MAEAAAILEGHFASKASGSKSVKFADPPQEPQHQHDPDVVATLEAFFGERQQQKQVFEQQQQPQQDSRGPTPSPVGRLTDSHATAELMTSLSMQLEASLTAKRQQQTLHKYRQQRIAARMQDCQSVCNRYMSWEAGCRAAKRGHEIQRVLRNIALHY